MEKLEQKVLQDEQSDQIAQNTEYDDNFQLADNAQDLNVFFNGSPQSEQDNKNNDKLKSDEKLQIQIQEENEKTGEKKQNNEVKETEQKIILNKVPKHQVEKKSPFFKLNQKMKEQQKEQEQEQQFESESDTTSQQKQEKQQQDELKAEKVVKFLINPLQQLKQDSSFESLNQSQDGGDPFDKQFYSKIEANYTQNLIQKYMNDPTNIIKNKKLKKVCAAAFFIGFMKFLLTNVRIKQFKKMRTQQIDSIYRKDKSTKIFPLMPNCSFLIFWNFILVILLVLTGLIVPIKVCLLEDDNSNSIDPLDTAFDVLFGIDFILNFVCSYYDKHGFLITNYSQIAINYLSGWFVIDLFALLPLGTIINAMSSNQDAAQSNKLVRLLRLPRLYRLIKILRITKMGNVMKKNPIMLAILEMFKFTVGVTKMVNILFLMLFMNHIMCCFWYFLSNIDDFGPNTWVARNGLIDEDYITKYITSYYWGIQTLTTIGYGDIVPFTTMERIFSIIYMTLGVGIYSSAIGNLADILENMDKNESILREKINSFNDFSAKAKIPGFLKFKVIRFFETNQRQNNFQLIEPKSLIQELPSFIRKELLIFASNHFLDDIYLFKIDINFTAHIIPHLRILQLHTKEILYREDDPAEEVFFIQKGKINLLTEEGIRLITILEGHYIGEQEILEKKNRLYFAQAKEECLLLILNKAQFIASIDQFPIIKTEIMEIYKRRSEKFKLLKHEKTSLFQNQGKLEKRLLRSTEYFSKIIMRQKTNQKNGKHFFVDAQPAEQQQSSQRSSAFLKFLSKGKSSQIKPTSSDEKSQSSNPKEKYLLIKESIKEGKLNQDLVDDNSPNDNDNNLMNFDKHQRKSYYDKILELNMNLNE